jgi:hypothetical protein
MAKSHISASAALPWIKTDHPVAIDKSLKVLKKLVPFTETDFETLCTFQFGNDLPFGWPRASPAVRRLSQTFRSSET